MDREAPIVRWVVCLLAGFLLWEMPKACAQSPPSDQSQKAGPSGDKKAQTDTKGRNSSSTKGQTAKKAEAKASGAAPRREFSEAYRESLRRTVEKRRELRSRRRMGSDASQPPGAIVPWPMPPALIIRQTPDVHGEIGNFLDVLRR